MTDPGRIAYYQALEARLSSLADLVEKAAGTEIAGWFREYVDVGEYGLAVEVVSEQLTASGPRDVSVALAHGLLSEAQTMNLAPEIIEHLRELTRVADA